VIAFEPQPRIAQWLRRIVRNDARITIRSEAVGREPGTARLAISRRTPTVSTLSARWQERMAESHPGFGGVRWDDSVEVPVVTLDALIESYGTPDFCKIDVEGHEPEVLAGLSRPLPALSFEFVSGDLTAAVACVQRLGRLGEYEFNVVLGEGRSFRWDAWQPPEAIVVWLGEGADGASSGDVYARVPGART
jgi:FkbM family methyltransferase